MISESKPISSEKLYHVWASMKDRCNNPKNKNLIINCKTGIKRTLEPLSEFLNIKDMRTISFML